MSCIVYFRCTCSSSCCSESFWHDYSIFLGTAEFCVTLLQSLYSDIYIQVTADVPLIGLVDYAAESFFHALMFTFCGS
jgi:hypothetical protein